MMVTEDTVMDCRFLGFGAVEIDGQTYDRDVVIEDGHVRRRKKGPSKPRRPEFGHTPLTAAERIPWSAPTLVVGSGADGQLPVTDDLYREAARRGVTVVVRPTPEACQLLTAAEPGSVAAVLHVTC
jgi:hypothetical protein